MNLFIHLGTGSRCLALVNGQVALREETAFTSEAEERLREGARNANGVVWNICECSLCGQRLAENDSRTQHLVDAHGAERMAGFDVKLDGQFYNVYGERISEYYGADGRPYYWAIPT